MSKVMEMDEINKKKTQPKVSKDNEIGKKEGVGRIMIVDDDQGPRKSLWMVFQDDYEVFLADSAQAAIKLSRQHKIDVAILDIRMPNMSGIELLSQLKKIDPNIQVVMLTAYETLKSLRESLNFGACQYINKPFEVSTVTAAVSTAMKARRSAQDSQDVLEKVQKTQTDLERNHVEANLSKIKEKIYPSVLHDIASPLTSIACNVETLAKEIKKHNIPTSATEKIQEQVQNLKNEVNRCKDIAERYTKVFQDKSDQFVGNTVLSDVLSDLRDVLKVHPQVKEKKLTVKMPEKNIKVRMSSVDIFQVIFNIAMNALQASSPKQEVTIEAELLMRSLELAHYKNMETSRFLNRLMFSNEAPILAIHVTDKGSGITPQVLSRMFESYFSTKLPGEGTGLGLFIVERLIKNANAALFVDTKVGEGTKMSIFISALPA